jgi:hypothetical protein
VFSLGVSVSPEKDRPSALAMKLRVLKGEQLGILELLSVMWRVILDKTVEWGDLAFLDL